MHAQPLTTPPRAPAPIDADAIASSTRLPGAESESRCGVALAPAAGDAFGLLLPVGMPAEMLRAARICSMPNTPAWFAGLANVRGNVVPVFDLLRYFGLGADVAAGQRADIVVVGIGTAAFAIPVKREPHILLVGANLVQAPPPSELRDFAGAAHFDDGMRWYEFLFDRWLALLAVDAPPPHLISTGESL